MDYRRANRAYLYTVIATLVFSFLYVAWLMNGEEDIPLTLNNFISEAVVLLPVLAVVLYSGDKLGVVIPMRKLRIPTVFLTMLYTMLLFPLVSFINSISMIFVGNEVMEMSDQILSEPVWTMILFVGIFGPFVEEVVFRGVLLQSYQRSGRIIASIILSSLLFGMAHLNFNQLAYGTVMGIMLALLVEATGSVIAPIIAHMCFNTVEVLMMFAQSDAIKEASSYLDVESYTDQYFLVVAIYFVAAIIGTSIALCVLLKISDLEGRKEFLISIPKCRKQGYKLITFPLVLAVSIAALFMVVTEWLSSLV